MKRITKPFLAILAIAAICMAGFQAMNTYTNFKAIPVTSNVMEPNVLRGSLLFMERIPEAELKPGDLIAVGLPNQQSHAVGRLIQSSEMADGYYSLTFKGDNRTLPEDFPYTVKDSTFLNKVTVPFVGFLFVFLSSPFGLILFAGASLFFSWYYLFKMHDRMTWAERSKKFLTYKRRVSEEHAEERKRFDRLDTFFQTEEPLEPFDDTEAIDVVEYDESVENSENNENLDESIDSTEASETFVENADENELILDSGVNETETYHPYNDDFETIIKPRGTTK